MREEQNLKVIIFMNIFKNWNMQMCILRNIVKEIKGQLNCQSMYDIGISIYQNYSFVSIE